MGHIPPLQALSRAAGGATSTLLLSAVCALILLSGCQAKELARKTLPPPKHYCRCPGGKLEGCSNGNQNLLLNGGGEVPGNPDVPSWKAGSGKPQVGEYGGANLCSWDCSAPGVDVARKVGGGTVFFKGSCDDYDGANTTFFQDIYVGCLAKKIDRKQVVARFQGLLGGCGSRIGAAHALMGFYAKYPHKRHPLGSLVKIGPVMPGHRNSVTTLLKKAAPTVGVPKGTRWIRVTVRIIGVMGMVDNLSVTLSPK